jgi:hypothetical protein
MFDRPFIGPTPGTEFINDVHLGGGSYSILKATLGFQSDPGQEVTFEIYIGDTKILDEQLSTGESSAVTCNLSGASNVKLGMVLGDVVSYPNDTFPVWGSAEVFVASAVLKGTQLPEPQTCTTSWASRLRGRPKLIPPISSKPPRGCASRPAVS